VSVVRKLSGRDGRRRQEDPGELYRTLFATMSEGFVICEVIRDASGRLVDYWVRDANPAFLKRAPNAAELIGRRFLEMRPNTPTRWFTACHVALTKGEPVRFEFWDDQAQRWFDVHMTRLSDDEVGQFYIDITERKKAERYQAELFDELNHRVKNNLTIVSGVLTMQAKASADPEVREQLLKAVDRIQSIADLHASLYRGGGRDEVEAQRYLAELCERLSRTLLEGRDVRLDLHAEALALPLDEAVQLGIIVNELVTNAAKHAYPQGDTGVVWIRLGRTEAGLRLCVSDLGRGLAPDSASGLGMRLVRSLVERAGGELKVDGGHGTSVEVRLPIGRRGDGPQQENLL
jgi:two-component sensor histidine kinase